MNLTFPLNNSVASFDIQFSHDLSQSGSNIVQIANDIIDGFLFKIIKTGWRRIIHAWWAWDEKEHDLIRFNDSLLSYSLFFGFYILVYDISYMLRSFWVLNNQVCSVLPFNIISFAFWSTVPCYLEEVFLIVLKVVLSCTFRYVIALIIHKQRTKYKY